MNKKAAIQLTANFLVMIIIAIVVFSFSIYFIKKVFTGAETTRTLYDQRIEKEIEKLLDDGSRIAIPFDKKTIYNGEFDTFGIGVLNVLNIGDANDFKIIIKFNKAFDKSNTPLCDTDTDTTEINGPRDCGNPHLWLEALTSTQNSLGIELTKSIKNNEQEKFLLGVGPTGAPAGTYIFDMKVCYNKDDDNLNNPSPSCYLDASDNTKDKPDFYGTLHKLYVEVP